MKRLFTLSLLLMSSASYAEQCRININHELRLDGEQLEIHQQDGGTAVMDEDNNLYIHGERIELNGDQQAAIEAYREKMNGYLPKAKAMANESLALANDIIDDIAESLDSPEAFDDVKASMKTFFADIEARYFKDGDFILPADSFDSMSDTWNEDMEKALELFNSEFFASAFEALSTKMDQEGGLNLTELSESLAELKVKLEKRFAEYAQENEQQANDLCDSLDEAANQEQDLLKKIPELKNYQVFTI